MSEFPVLEHEECKDHEQDDDDRDGDTDFNARLWAMYLVCRLR